MRILLTGGTGFLGSALARHWHLSGHEVIVLGRASSKTSRIESLLPAMQFVRFREMSELAAVVAEARPDAIVHTACSYGRAGESTLQVFDANVRFGLSLLQAHLDASEGRMTMINTGTVLAPEVNLYALSKSQFSQWGSVLARRNPQRLQFIDVLLQHMYGPGDDNSKFTAQVLRSCRDNAPRLSLTSGQQRRDLIHVDDVVQAYDIILQRRGDFAAADAIDVGSGKAPRIRDFVELARNLTGASTALDFGAVPHRENEAMLCVADIRRLAGLGWAPRFDLESGLRHTLQKELEQ